MQDLQSQIVSEQLVHIQNIFSEKAELTTFINAAQTHGGKMNKCKKTVTIFEAVFRLQYIFSEVCCLC